MAVFTNLYDKINILIILVIEYCDIDWVGAPYYT